MTCLQVSLPDFCFNAADTDNRDTHGSFYLFCETDEATGFVYQRCLGKGDCVCHVAISAHINGVCTGLFAQGCCYRAVIGRNAALSPILHCIQSYQNWKVRPCGLADRANHLGQESRPVFTGTTVVVFARIGIGGQKAGQ